MAKYPSMSPYCAFNNNPVYFTDPSGLEGVDPSGDNGQEVNIAVQDNISWNSGNNPTLPRGGFDNYEIDQVFNNKTECLLPGADVPANVFLNVREKGGYEDVTSTYRKDTYIEGDFLIIYGNSLEEVNRKRNDFLGNTKSPYSVINLHGGSESYRDGDNNLIYTGTIYINNDDRLKFDKYDINDYLNERLKRDEIKSEIDALVSIINATSSDCLLLPCRGGSDKTLVKRMEQLYKSKVTSGANLFLNSDYTSVYLYNGTNRVDLHSEPLTRSLKSGWIKINVNGITFLINSANNTGNIILDGYSNSPIIIENKSGL